MFYKQYKFQPKADPPQAEIFMRKMIHNLRAKSEQTRRDILHALTLIFALILIFTWIYSLGRHLSNADVQEKVKGDLKPFAALKDNMVGGYKSIPEPNLGIE